MIKIKRKNPNSNQGPISKKVTAEIKKFINAKVVDFSEIRNAKVIAENLNKGVITEKELSAYDPLHAVYIYAQNKIAVFCEQLSEIPALLDLTNAYVDAEEMYLPSAPPMSPLTKSYFNFWGGFDLCVGAKRETFGTVIIDVCKTLNADSGLIRIIECMQKTRMGFYILKDFSERFVYLEEFITGKQITAISPAGYMGKPGQIWFVRVMPEPFPELNVGYSLVFTTPYIICEMKNNQFLYSKPENWFSFFNRNLAKTGIQNEIEAYEHLMKYGLDRHYWNEYIFEGFVNYEHNMIMLAGFPDIPKSRPHSKENSEYI